MWNHTTAEALGIRYPIIQAPMLGVTSPEMVAAVIENLVRDYELLIAHS